jgi:hypothetical protein
VYVKKENSFFNTKYKMQRAEQESLKDEEKTEGYCIPTSFF